MFYVREEGLNTRIWWDKSIIKVIRAVTNDQITVISTQHNIIPENKVYGANMGPT